jgi:MFS family permease
LVANVRHSSALPASARPGARAFAILYAIESVSRASLSSIIPIQAYDLLRDERAVSVLYFAVGVAGLGATICVPLLANRTARRRVYTIGALSLVAACAMLASFTLPGQAAGMFVRIFGASTLAITLNLYILDFIHRHDFVRAESLRLTMAALSWTLCPALGVWLYTRYGIAAPYVWSAAWALVLIAVFWHVVPAADRAAWPNVARLANPLANIGRFVRQPRLRLAWLIAFCRSTYWNTFYAYAPILLVATGQGKLAGGLIVSAGNTMLILALVCGRLGGRYGVRAVVSLSFVGLTVCAAAAGLAGEARPLLAGGLLLAGVLFAVALDAVGGAPFLRAVHPHERSQMTAVYRTNLDMSELLPPLVYSLILSFTGLGGVFLALGIFSALSAWVSWRYLPRSM